MSTGLLDQIQAYASDIEAAQSSVTADEVAARIDVVRELPLVAEDQTRSRRGVWTVVAVAALVALLLGLPLLISRTGSDTPPATTPPTTVATVTSTTTVPLTTTVPEGASASADTDTVAWDRYTMPPSGPVSIERLATGDGQYLAYLPSMLVGQSQPGDLQPANEDDIRTKLWTSTDGVNWDFHHLDFFDGDVTWLVGEANGVFVVNDVYGEGWYRSDDLETWEPVVLPLAAFRMTATDASVIAWDYSSEMYVFDTDVRNYQTVDVPSFRDPDDAQNASFSLVATADRYYMVVLEDIGSNQGTHTVWSSSDGLDWQREAIPGLPLTTEADSGTTRETALFANSRSVLLLDRASPASEVSMWISTNGGAFTPLEPLSEVRSLNAAATEDGFLIANLFTTDGNTWSETGRSVVTRQFQAVGSTYVTPVLRQEGTISSESWLLARTARP